MTTQIWSKAYTEVLEIIKYFPEEEYNKIPKEKIEFYKENMDKSYNFLFNPDIDLSEQNISKEAYAIFVSLYKDYFATETEKNKINYILKENEEKSEAKKRERYNPDDVFRSKEKKETQQVDTKQTSMIEYKENFFERFKKFILKLFHKEEY